MVWHCKPKSSSEITKNEDFLMRSKNLVRISFGLYKKLKIIGKLQKLAELEFFTSDHAMNSATQFNIMFENANYISYGSIM